MISREIGLLRSVEVHPRRHTPLVSLTGTEATSRHLRTLAGLFCDHELPRNAITRLPALDARIFFDDQAWRVHGFSVCVQDRQLTLNLLLEDTAVVGRLHQVAYWREEVEVAYALALFHCRAQHAAGPTEAVLAILDVARQLYTVDAPAKATAVAKLAHAICKRHEAFALHFTHTGIYALSGREYVGAVPRLEVIPGSVSTVRLAQCG